MHSSPLPALRHVILHCAPLSQTTEHGGSSHVTSHVDPALQVTVVVAFDALLVFSTTHVVPERHSKLHSGPAQAEGEQGHALAQTMVQSPPVQDVHTEAASPDASPESAPSAFDDPSGTVVPGRPLSLKRSS